MHEYMTRHMEAKTSFTYAGQALQPGEPFLATPVDAEYLKRHKKADDGQPGPAHKPGAHAPPQAFEAAPNTDAPAAIVPPTAKAEPAAETARADETAPVLRRRGRPTNAERDAARAAEATEASEGTTQS